jgi:predicted permease
MLARAAARRREISTRLALGSSRARIARQGLIETFLLSVAGGLLGLGVAFAVTRALIAFVSQGSAWIAISPAPDFPVLLFTLGVSVITGILFGFAPAIVAARTEAQGVLSAGNRNFSAGGGKSSRWWSKSLVIGQVMLSLLLLVAAGLFLRTLRNLQNQNFGFERAYLLVADFDARLAGYTPAQAPELHQRLLDRLSAIPGVRSAALAVTPPISTGNWRSNISIAGYTPAPKESMNSALNRVSGRYFETAGIQVVQGRSIAASDTPNGTKVAVVNQTLARRFFPRGGALGHSLTIGMDSVAGPWQIVGVARDTKSGDPRSQDPKMMVYIPLAQIEPFAPGPTGSREQNEDRLADVILLRTTGDPSHRISDLRDAVAQVDPNLPLIKIRTMQQEVSRMMSDDQLISSLTSIFAGLALALAAIGLYGVMSYNVVQRTNEIGVRLAVGAQTNDVLWMVLKDALLLLTIGAALGLPISLAAARIVRHQLFQVRADDPLTYIVALIAVTTGAIISAWLPACRAAAVNPVEALRCE